MASTHKHIRSGTANKRPTTAIADGQIALNTNTTSPGLYFKDSTGASIIKVGPVHVGSTAPNVSPPTGGSSGNSAGEVWLDTSLTPAGVKIWNGSAWVNATPVGSTTVQGLLELATSAETQAGSDTDRAVTPAGLQSKLSDSTSTTSSTTIASSTAVKAAYDLAAAALPKSGGTITGNLEIGTTGSLTFEGATADAFETTLAVVDPTADRTITLPNTTGTVVTTGDTGTVTSTMLLDGTILNADVNASAAIAGTKISPDFGSQTIVTTGVYSAAGGSAAAPSITFTGDTNTGIYSPGADQVAISTSGTGRLFVNASGNFGVGSSGPARKLVVSNAGAEGFEVGPGESSNLNQQLHYNRSSSTYVTNRIDAADHLFWISGTERMRITSAGLLGLGTSSPGSPLTIESNAGNQVKITYPSIASYFLNATSGGDFAINKDGTERARIDSSGRLLVGTSSSVTSFQVQVEGTTESNSAFSVRRNNAGSFGPAFGFYKSRGTATGSFTAVSSGDSLGQLYFFGADGTQDVAAATITAAVDGTPGSNDMPGRLVFSTTADGAASPTERLRITSAGNVGIGTSSPAQALHVLQSGGNNFAGIRTQNSNSGTGIAGLEFSSDATYAKAAVGLIRNDANGVGSLVFYNASSTGAANWSTADERLRIDSSGRLGLGTSSPSSLLHLVSSGQPKITVADDGGRTLQIYAPDSSANPGFIGTTTNHDLLIQAGTTAPGLNVMRFNTAGAERVRITDTGLVGIGTTSPAYALDVASADTTASIGYALRLRQNATAGAAAIQFTDNPVTTQYGYIACDSSSNLKFATGLSERARIDSSGRLLVGTSSARSNFENSTLSAAVQVEGTDYAGSRLALIRNGGGGGINLCATGGASVGSNTAVSSGAGIGEIAFFGSDGSEFVTGALIQAFVDGTPGANDMPGRLVFSTTPDGAASPTERMRIASDGALTYTINSAVRMFIDSSNNGSTHFSCTAVTGTDNAPNAEGGIIHQSNGNTKVRGTSANNTLFQWYYFNNTTSNVGNITVGASSTSYNTSSDYRLKENIVPLTGAIDRLNDLQIHRFNFKANPDHTVDGFLAHEAQAVVPECVTGAKDEVDADGNPVYQGIDQSKLVPLLTAALQEAIAKIETLETRLSALEAA
jgi:hypothetical protein